MAVVSFAFLVYLNVIVGILFVLFSFLSLVITTRLQRPLETLSQSWSQSNSKTMNFIKGVLTGRASATIYGTAGLERAAVRLNTTTEHDYQTLNVRTMRVAWSGWLLSIISYLVPISVGVELMATGANLTGADLLAMFLASDRVVGPLRNIGQYRAQIKTTKSIRTKISTLVNSTHPDLPNFELSKPRPLALSVANLNYRINDQQRIEIEQLVLHPGENILISGPSGIGKTTLTSLLLGLQTPDKGTVTLINADSTTTNQTAHQAFALISQTPFVFSGTVAENLSLMQPRYSETAMLQVLHQVGLSNELGSNPLHYLFNDEQNNLSGGQKQRLDVARALLFSRPIIVCDEITAALDDAAARQVRQALYQSSSTIIEIAHHFAESELAQSNVTHYSMNRSATGVVSLELVD